MVANFKDSNKIIITGADKAEALLISQLVALAANASKKVTLEVFNDIEGDVFGATIEVKDTTVTP